MLTTTEAFFTNQLSRFSPSENLALSIFASERSHAPML